ncbi:MAG TPA: rod shape-determining protein RodA, partial [Sphingomonas bacterium]|nr:rod shape-determining protein RodA [Sphingomonas bacterium]
MRLGELIPAPIAQLPWHILFLILAIGGFGTVVLFSAAGGSFTPWAWSQGIRLLVFLGLAVVLSWVPMRFWEKIALPGYGITLAALVAVELLGAVKGGSQRWLDLGFIRLQPSEFMKLFMVLAAARFYAMLPGAEVRRFGGIWPAVGLIAMPAALVM